MARRLLAGGLVAFGFLACAAAHSPNATVRRAIPVGERPRSGSPFDLDQRFLL